MGQALTLLSRNLIPLLCCLILAACNGSYTAFESDRDVDVDNKTVDLEQDNAEMKLLAVLQSAFTAHYQTQAYTFLDASDLPAGAEATSAEKQFQRVCGSLTEPSGTATYSYTREAGEKHKAGDKVSVVYDACVEGEFIYDGRMTANYTKIKGLNTRFTAVSTEQCLGRLQDKLDMEKASPDAFVYNPEFDVYVQNDVLSYPREAEVAISNKSVIYLTGDELTFTRVGNDIRVDLLTVEFEETSDKGMEKISTLELSFVLSEDDKALFILQPVSPSDTQITSIDGDQIYSLVKAEDTQEKCQAFERTLSVNFDDFSTTKQGALKTAFDGSVTLRESQDTPNRVDQSFLDSDFKTIVTQEAVTDVFSMKGYRVEKAVNIANKTYAYEFEGMISNGSVLDGKLQLTTFDKLFGSFDSAYPNSGRLQVLAKGLESMIMTSDNLNIRLQVDYNGDSTGNGLGDSDVTINTTWTELFDRDFKE